MEEIDFISIFGHKTITFSDFHEALNWPVPRVGEKVSVRKDEDYMMGTVLSVEYYYSIGNWGPVVKVYIQENL